MIKPNVVDQILENFKNILLWDPEKHFVIDLVESYKKLEECVSSTDISTDELYNVIPPRAAKKFKKIAQEYDDIIWACDFIGNCIVYTSDLEIMHINDIKEL